MMAHVTNAPKAPSKLRPDIPPALERLILDALAKAPEQAPAVVRRSSARGSLDAIAQPRASKPRGRPDGRRAPPTRDRRATRAATRWCSSHGGPFAMGPSRREVHIDALYVDRTAGHEPRSSRLFVEVDRLQARRDAGAKRFLAHWRNGKPPRGEEKHPVVYVSWFDARAYAAWAGQAPAHRGRVGEGRARHRRPQLSVGPRRAALEHANYGRSRDGTTPVGAFPEGASPYGILDLAGNVWEWCEDAYDDDFYVNGPRHEPEARQRAGKNKSGHVMRGGSFMYDARALRTYARMHFDPHYRFAEGGFRCAKAAT